jgi:hypothetical protein
MKMAGGGMKKRSIDDPRLTEGRRAALYALQHQRTVPNQHEMMKRLKWRLRCPIPLNGMDCQFPNCGCDLPPDEPEATVETQSDLSALVAAYLARGGKITKCRPGKKPS